MHAKERSRSEDGQVLHYNVIIMHEDGSFVASEVDLNLKRAGGKALIENKQSRSVYRVRCIGVRHQPLIGGTSLSSDACTWATGLIAIITNALQLVNYRRRGAIRSDSGNFDTTAFFGFPLVSTTCHDISPLGR